MLVSIDDEAGSAVKLDTSPPTPQCSPTTPHWHSRFRLLTCLADNPGAHLVELPSTTPVSRSPEHRTWDLDATEHVWRATWAKWGLPTWESNPDG